MGLNVCNFQMTSIYLPLIYQKISVENFCYAISFVSVATVELLSNIVVKSHDYEARKIFSSLSCCNKGLQCYKFPQPQLGFCPFLSFALSLSPFRGKFLLINLINNIIRSYRNIWTAHIRHPPKCHVDCELSPIVADAKAGLLHGIKGFSGIKMM